MAAKKAYGIVPDNVYLPLPEPFLGGHDGEIVKILIIALDMYFQVIDITDDNTQVVFAKTLLNSLA